MDARRFDALARSLVAGLPRRGLLRKAGAAALGLATLGVRQGQVAAQETESVGLPCSPCNCTDSGCDCCLIGITGGGVVRTTAGDINLVLFATQLAPDAPQEAAGFVRWLDPTAEDGLVMESVGPVAYDWPEGEEHLRNVRGVMSINGESEHPFVLEVFDAGPDLLGQDTARLTVGNAAADGESSGFSYDAAGTVVGGDIQLLDSVAPIAPST